MVVPNQGNSDRGVSSNNFVHSIDILFDGGTKGQKGRLPPKVPSQKFARFSNNDVFEFRNIRPKPVADGAK